MLILVAVVMKHAVQMMMIMEIDYEILTLITHVPCAVPTGVAALRQDI